MKHLFNLLIESVAFVCVAIYHWVFRGELD